MQSDHVTTDELSALLDGELSANERATVDAHLAGCVRCRGDLEELRQTVLLLRSVPQPPLRRSLALGEGAEHASPARPRPLVRPEWLRALAGVAAGLMVVVFVFDAVVLGAGSSASVRMAAEVPAARVEIQRPMTGAEGAAPVAPVVQPPRAGAEGRASSGPPAEAPAAPVSGAESGLAPGARPFAEAPTAPFAAPTLAPAAEAPSAPPPAPARAVAPALRTEDRATGAMAPAEQAAGANQPSASNLQQPGAPSAADSSREFMRLRADAPREPQRAGPSLGQVAAGVLGAAAIILLAVSLLLPRRPAARQR